MINTSILEPRPLNSHAIAWWLNLYQHVWLAGLIGVSALVGLYMLETGPTPVLVCWMLLGIGIASIFYQPRYGIYLTLFFGLAGDARVLPWYPFTKNMSSYESMFFLHNALIFSPLELCIILTLVSWLLRGFAFGKLTIFRGILFWPTIAFVVFLVFGLIYGLSRGGNVNIALWEARPIFYMPIMLFLTSNLINRRQYICRLLWFIMLALFIEGLVGSSAFFFTLNATLAGVESLTEHSSAIHLNTFFVFVSSVWIFRASRTKRIILPLMLPAVALTYLASQRRAAFLSLGVVLPLLFLCLYQERRRLFWIITPIFAAAVLAYLAIFWNSNSALALPASAVKSMVAPDLHGKDAGSNLYRLIENVNINFTLHQVPLTGVGFGMPFFILVRMPDISWFEWWEYIVHNSILWYWLQTGVFGFISLLLLIGLSIMTGARAIWRMPGGDLSAAAVTATLYVIMHFMYAYVDMSWDIQSMIYVGAMMGIINCIEHVVAQPVERAAKRWPWQKEPPLLPGLLPLSSAQERSYA